MLEDRERAQKEEIVDLMQFGEDGKRFPEIRPLFSRHSGSLQMTGAAERLLSTARTMSIPS